jgi:membrane protein
VVAGSDAVPQRATPLTVASRAFSSFRRHHMTDHAAGLTYYLVMSLFPGLLVAVSLFGLIASPDTVVNATRYLRDAGAPPSAARAVHDALANLVATSGGKAGVALVLGVALGLNSASSAFGAAGRALNVVYDIEEDRGFVRRKALDLAFTAGLIVLGLVAVAGVLLGGSVTHDLLNKVGLGDTATAVFALVRWPIAIAAMTLAFGVVYGFAPDRGAARFRWISPGACAGALIWLVASILFFLYVENFGSYGATYGAFAGAVILLLWLYLSSIAFLFGGELNAELERGSRAAR